MWTVPQKTLHRYFAVAALLFFSAGAAVLIGLSSKESYVSFSQDPARSGITLSQSLPARLVIPAIGVDASFETIGLEESGEIEIPNAFDTVGWYKHGVTPGELGSAVILGHVDSMTGPAVFYSLGQLKQGDTIEVTRADGSIAVFRVDTLQRYFQTEFPTQLVYGTIDHAGIRLVTCSGIYDRETKRYDQNLVAYGSLIEVK